VESSKLDPPITQQKHSIIVDSGSTAHYCTTELPVQHKRECKEDIRIKAANGSIMRATHIAELNYPRRVYVVPELAGRTLISVGQLCDAGCTVQFEAEKCRIQYKGETVLYGTRSNGNTLWQLEQPIMNAIVQMHEAAAAIHNNTVATMGYPTIATLKRAIMKGFLEGFPGLTLKWLKDYPPISEATIMGHLKQKRKNVRSTKKRKATEGEQSPQKMNGKTNLAHEAASAKCEDEQRENESDDGSLEARASEITNSPTNQCTLKETATGETPEHIHNDSTQNEDMDGQFPEASGKNDEQRSVYVSTYQPLDKSYVDATGEFVAKTTNGDKLIYVFYHYDSNYIFAVTMKSTSDAAQTEAFNKVYETLKRAGMTPKMHIVDNQCGIQQKAALEKGGVQYQLVPPGMHRYNAAERAIQTFKSHFISILCGTDPNCPIIIWGKFVRQAEITLNLMRASRIDPTKSAYEQMHGKFDYNVTPMAPLGQAVMVHDKPQTRQSWDPRASKGYYIGPALKHYRCFQVHMEKTQTTRITDTMVWLQGKTRVPRKLENEKEVEMDEFRAKQRQLTEIFDPTMKEDNAGEMGVGAETKVPGTENSPEMRVGIKELPPAITEPPKRPEGPEPTYADVTGSAGVKYRKRLREERQKRLPAKLRDNHANAAEHAGNKTTVEIWGTSKTDAEYLAFYGHAIDPDTNKFDRIHTSLAMAYHSPLLGVDIDTARVCDPDLF
jgi:hypothetical protein